MLLLIIRKGPKALQAVDGSCLSELLGFFFCPGWVFFLQVTLLEIQALQGQRSGQGEQILHIPPVLLSQGLGWLWGGERGKNMKWELLLPLLV